MRSIVVAAVALVCVPGFLNQLCVADDGANSLQGVWNALSAESDGQPLPEEAVRRLRFTFKGDKLVIRGNQDNDSEEECDFQADMTKSPGHLDFAPPTASKKILGIVELKGDELKVCLRHDTSADGRPTQFATEKGSGLILVVLKRQAS